jgi:hypothetical protein
MKSKIPAILIVLILGALLFSFGINRTDSPDSSDADAIRTEAVATFASSMTETLAAAPPAFSPPTISPAFTPTVPAPTVEVSPTPTTNPCFNLLYLADVTIEDGTRMKAGEVFTKTWLVQNIGGCAWRAGFTFRHVGGDPMRGETVTLTEAVPTGARREISVQFVVPGGQGGLAQSSWRMADETGSFFGDTLSVNIIVEDAGAPTATP